MKKRFESLSIPYKLFDEGDYVYTKPQEELYKNAKDLHTKRVLSCILNHLSIISYYYSQGKEYIIVSEDDVMLHKDWKRNVEYVVDQMKQFSIDIALLGYLLPTVHTLPGFYDYSQDLWGTQMYVLGRNYAKQLLDRFCHPAHIHLEGLTFAADWIITKLATKKAYFYPALALEEGQSGDGNDIHQRFHNYCTSLHKNSNYI